MLSDKELKKKFVPEFSKNPEKYYPGILKELGLTRKKCRICKRFFWAVDSDTCGDASCSGGYTFIGNTPAKKSFNYIDLWNGFSKTLKKTGYIPIKSYPVVARWREDINFVEASIDDFIPFVISGQSDPPANPLIVPQFCLRFNDTDNVGITGAHYTGFIMVGQHRFEKPENYDSSAYLSHLLDWFTKTLKIPLNELKFHEDVWAGSGNFGPCIEIFSRGLELANQVYMQFRQKDKGFEELGLKVLDMGLGYERNVWFSQGMSTSYETTFPTVVRLLKKRTGIKTDKELLNSFLPYSSLLNIDEIENAEKVWKNIAEKLKTDYNELKNSIMPLAALYALAEHSRSLLVAITDGALPSNVGGGYNLRIILRRALGFIEEFGLDVDLKELCRAHALYLKKLNPRLVESLDEVNEILGVEEKRFAETRNRSVRLIESLVKKGRISEEKMIELYESNGITPELIEKMAGDVFEIDAQKFYAKLAEKHVAAKQEEKKEIDLRGIPPTRLLFYEDQNKTEFTAKVLKIIHNKYVVLDQSYFYGRSGGQEPDHGFMNRAEVYDVEKIGNVIVHHVEEPDFREGDTVRGRVDKKRRIQLTKHHTATHIINATARQILGNHIWQHSAYKDMEKARLDITHYESLQQKKLDQIEKLANAAVKKNMKIRKLVLPRMQAEKKYGFRIYQGGAVPEKMLRIIETPIDVEACGGLHCNRTKEVGEIMITGSERIQDGIIRLEFTAGEATEREVEKIKKIIEESSKILGVQKNNLLAETEKLFRHWKDLRKRYEKRFKSGVENRLEVMKEKMVNNVLVAKTEADMKELQAISRALSNNNTIIILFGLSDKIYVFASAGNNTDIDIGKVVKKSCKELDGKGGGSRLIGQGIGTRKDKLDEVIENLRKELL